MPAIEPLTPAQIPTLADLIDPATGPWCCWPPGAGVLVRGSRPDPRPHPPGRHRLRDHRPAARIPARRHPPQPGSGFAAAVRLAEDRGCPPGHPAARHRDRGAAQHLRRYPPGPAGLVFTTPVGNVLYPANWRQRIWRPLIRSAPGIPPGTTFHRLRRAYASLLGAAARPDHDIQRRLGHAHPGEIRWYRHPYPNPGDSQPPATPSTTP
jgi:integrase